MNYKEMYQKAFDEYTVPEDLDVYGFLKHYRDLMSWSEPSLVAIGTTDAMIILEKFWRQKIAKEIKAVMCDTPNHGDSYQDMKHEVADWAFKEAIRIARGEPNED